ncbi:MAG: NUDIX hydrolase [Gammaproteobacteria bacterium]|nr:NUDIX hydrolase [Gammaproteobacteria bacterium]
MSDDQQASAPLPAATILMLRDGPAGLEVFMVVRHHQIDFASGALVFPGGKADAQDFDAALEPYLDGAAEDADMRAIQVSAIREAFEECGILLAREAGQAGLVDSSRLAELEPYRTSLHDGSVSMLQFLEREGLHLACAELVHFAHWVTPTMMPKRFDTHFFLAAAPSDHLAVHDGHESVDSIWIRPADVLEQAARGQRTVIFPTLRNVEKLSAFVNVREALDATAAAPVVRVEPWTEQRNGGTYLCIPREAGYTVCEELLPERQ